MTYRNGFKRLENADAVILMNHIVAHLELLEILERYTPYLSFPVTFMGVEFAEDVGFGIEIKSAEDKAGMQIDGNPACLKLSGVLRTCHLLRKKVRQLRNFTARAGGKERVAMLSALLLQQSGKNPEICVQLFLCNGAKVNGRSGKGHNADTAEP